MADAVDMEFWWELVSLIVIMLLGSGNAKRVEPAYFMSSRKVQSSGPSPWSTRNAAAIAEPQDRGRVVEG